MAKILVITRFLNQQSLAFAESLKAQNHDVLITTGYDQRNSPELESTEIPVHFLFKRWSLIEAPLWIPQVLKFHPEIVHFFIQNEKLTAAEASIAWMSKNFFQFTLSTSIIELQQQLHKLNPLRYLAQESDLLTLPSHADLHAIRGLNIKNPHQARGVLSPFVRISGKSRRLNEKSEIFAEIEKWTQSKKFFIVPLGDKKLWEIDRNWDLIRTLSPAGPLIFLGSQKSWSARERQNWARELEKRIPDISYLVSGELTQEEKMLLGKKAQCLSVAGMELSSLELCELFAWVLESGTTLVLDEHQATVHSALWESGTNCWIVALDNLLPHLREVLQREDLKLKMSKESLRSQTQILVDNPINEISRLYSKALAHK